LRLRKLGGSWRCQSYECREFLFAKGRRKNLFHKVHLDEQEEV
jgi:hypothetical protein